MHTGCSTRGASAASPQGTDDLPSGDDVYTDAPVQSTILGAAKLTGRVGKFSIGVMQAVQQEESATVLDDGIDVRSSRSSRSRATPSAACGASSRTSRRSASCSPRANRRLGDA